jgi:hypothetical protein
MIVLDADRSPRERLLGMARAARESPVAERRRTALALMRMALGWEEGIGRLALHAPRTPLCTEAEIFEAAYGDPTGAEYWQAWVEAKDNYEPPPPPDASEGDRAAALARQAHSDIVKLLATHLAHERLRQMSERESPTNAPVGVFAIGRPGGRLSILGLMQQECARALTMIPPGALRGRLLQLFENPNTRHLVPASLRAFLTKDNEESTAACEKESAPDEAPEAVPAAEAAAPSEEATELPKGDRRAAAAAETVPKDELFQYLKGVATKDLTQGKLYEHAQDHFKLRPVPRRLFRDAYKDLPKEQKRRPGERGKSTKGQRRE